MNVKLIDLTASKKKNENVQKRILQHQNQTQKHFVLTKPGTPVLSDKSEFPSLSESLGRASNYLPSSGGSLKYSDKLKLPSSSRNQASVSGNMHFKCNTSIADPHHWDNKVTRSRFQEIDSKNEIVDNSRKNISKQASNHSTNKSMSLSNDKNHLERNEMTRNKPVLKSKHNNQNVVVKTSNFSSGEGNMLAKSSNKSVNVESSESKEENSATQDSSKANKKKKRKSKIKRHVALQSGKITFLTPEVHSKILNQASTLNTQYSVKTSVIGNIDDEEEYPELGKAVLPISQKENLLKKNISSECQVEVADKSVDSSIEKNVISENVVIESSVITASEKTVVEKKEKNDKVHSHNPITISFYDMLLEKNVKKKEIQELKDKIESPDVIALSKLKNKKNSGHPHNLLDASSPAVKRGKERENPKPKKPSQLKKIILLDRKSRREHLLQMKNNYEEENVTNENGLIFELNEDENNQATAEKRNQCENNFEDDFSALWEENEECFETILQLTESSDISVPDELVSEMINLNISKEIDSYNNVSDLTSDFREIVENEAFIEKSTSALTLNERSRTENGSCMESQINNQPDSDTEMHLMLPQSPESLLNCLACNIKPDISEKERAVKILLHTRNFREYCNHLISKDIDDATYALLDDLARFQDRLHQKDPIKARMKRRMIYGVKEVKKHIKLRKVKCIIIAVDIENVEAQGGLNDILNEIKVSAVDHHIPYVFALSRKVLGKVCRKPVPVSCVGVFNYEGSEANFKKMVELQSQSKADYSEIFNKLLVKITDEEVAVLLKAKKEAPETLRAVRTNVLSNFFLPFDSLKSEDENTDSKTDEDMSNLVDIPI